MGLREPLGHLSVVAIRPFQVWLPSGSSSARCQLTRQLRLRITDQDATAPASQSVLTGLATAMQNARLPLRAKVLSSSKSRPAAWICALSSCS